MLAAHGLEAEGAEYGSEVSFVIHVALRAEDEVTRALGDATAGRARIERLLD